MSQHTIINEALWCYRDALVAVHIKCNALCLTVLLLSTEWILTFYLRCFVFSSLFCRTTAQERWSSMRCFMPCRGVWLVWLNHLKSLQLINFSSLRSSSPSWRIHQSLASLPIRWVQQLTCHSVSVYSHCPKQAQEPWDEWAKINAINSKLTPVWKVCFTSDHSQHHCMVWSEVCSVGPVAQCPGVHLDFTAAMKSSTPGVQQNPDFQEVLLFKVY